MIMSEVTWVGFELSTFPYVNIFKSKQTLLQ